MTHPLDRQESQKFRPEAVARIGYNSPHIKPYESSDLQYGPLSYALGLSGAAAFDMDGNLTGNVRAEIDALVKAQGLSVTGSFFIRSDQDGTGYFDQFFGGIGAYAQAGYVINGMVEPAFRYTNLTLRPSASADYETNNQLTAAINLYFFGQSLKWQNECTVDLKSQGANVYRWLSQLQMAF